MPWGQVLRRLARDTRAALRGRDLPLHGAGLTFYAALSVVPVMLVTGWLASLVVGTDQMLGLARSLEDALPQALDAGAVARTLIESSADLGWMGVLVAALPASLYGEGLRRACASLVQVDAGRLVGWRGRLGAAPVVLVAPALLLGVLAVTPVLDDLMGTGLGATALGTYLALNVSWVAVSVVLAWVFVAVVPDPPSRRHAAIGGVVTAAFVAGFLQGVVLFLSLPIDLGLPFGGLTAVGAVVAGLLWMWVLHLVVLIGWVATRHASLLRLRMHAEPSEHMIDSMTDDNESAQTPTSSDAGHDQPGVGSPEKDPQQWTTGGEPATGPQLSYLETLAREAGEEAPAEVTKAEASEQIDRLQQETGRGA